MKYSVLNFKSLNTEKMMNIKPITIFCGVNSSGKSSIIQSMLLLSQSILYARETLRYLPRPYNIRRYRRYRELKEKESKEKKPKVLIFEGDKCHLQGFRNVIFENDISNNLTFKWSYNLDDELLMIEISCGYKKGNKSPEHSEDLLVIKKVNIQRLKNDYENIYLREKYKKETGNKTQYRYGGITKYKKEYITWRDRYLLNLSKTEKKALDEKLKKKYTQTIEISLNKDEMPYYDVYLYNIDEKIKDLEENLKSQFYQKDSALVIDLLKKKFLKKITISQDPDNNDSYKILKFEKVLISFTSIFPNNIHLNREIFTNIIKEITKEGIPNFEIIEKYYQKNRDYNQIDEFFCDDFVEAFEDFLNYDIFPSLEEDLIDYYINLKYIGPLREEPKRFYSFSDLRAIELGMRGENTTHVLTVNKEQKIRVMKIMPDEDKWQFQETERRLSLLSALNEWLKIMNLQTVEPEQAMELIAKLKIFYSKNQPTTSPVSIPDVGFGLSQVLPVLVGGLLLNVGETLILEQPEIHLHPRMQGDLADFILCNAKLGKNFIIETHSEHFIKRLCLRTAQFTEEDLSDLFSIYFIVPNEDNRGAKIVNVEIDEYGTIINWPKGFFDDDEDRLLLEASYYKRQKKEEEGKK